MIKQNYGAGKWPGAQTDTNGYKGHVMDTNRYKWRRRDTNGYEWIQTDTNGYSTGKNLRLDTIQTGACLVNENCNA